MSYTLFFHPFAQADYDHIYEYILERSPQGAESWDLALDGAIADLGNDPNRHAHIPESVVGRSEYRQAFFRTRRGKRYRLIFVVEGSIVTILRIRGPGQADVTPLDLP